MWLELMLFFLGHRYQGIQGQNAFHHSLQNLPEDLRKYPCAAPFAVLAALQAVYLLASPSLGDLQSHVLL